MVPTTISLDSDDEDDAHVHVTGRGTSKDAPVELSSDDDDDAPTAGSGAGAAGSSRAGAASVPSTNTAAGSSTSALVMDLTGEEEDVPGCGICGKLTGARESFRLDECGHSFCEGCVRGFVTKKVSETLAHEVGCPKCGRQLSIGNVNELAKSSGEPGAKRPRPGAPMAWRGGGPAALLAHLAGVGGGMPGGGHAGRRVAGNPAATKRIMRELQALQKAETAAQGFEVSVPDDSDAYTWQAEFFDFEKGSGLAADLKRVPGKRIVLSVSFPSSFPAQPPYVRVIRPRFAFRTGHVTIGGSICTEMLSSQACAQRVHSVCTATPPHACILPAPRLHPACTRGPCPSTHRHPIARRPCRPSSCRPSSRRRPAPVPAPCRPSPAPAPAPPPPLP